MALDIFEKIDDCTREIQEMISTLDKHSTIPQLIVLKSCSQLSVDYDFDGLTSKTKQYAYLVSLVLNSQGHSQLTTSDFIDICQKLNELEDLYRSIHICDYDIQPDNFRSQRKSIIVQSCYACKHFNTELLYKEQEIDRIERVFLPFNQSIQLHEGISLTDYLNFYIDTERILDRKYQSSIESIFSNNTPLSSNVMRFYNEKGECVAIPNDVYKKLTIKPTEYELVDVSVASRLLKEFATYDKGNETPNELNYYCTYNNVIEDYPIIGINDDEYMIFDSNYLIVAIYHHLSRKSYIDNSSLSKSKARAIESKVVELFRDCFPEGTCYANYSIKPKGPEKDFIFISGSIAIIIECKSDKQSKYSKDMEKSFHVIEQDFKSSIQKGYNQAAEVAQFISGSDEVTFYKKDSNSVLGSIQHSSTITEIHIIVVTEERYSVLQNSLDWMLSNEIYQVPATSICIDDLETELLTFCRFEKPFEKLCDYLRLKEKVTNRILYVDELDLAAYYIQFREGIVEILNSNEEYRIDQSYANFFDVIYNNGGIGFKKELYYPGKVHIGPEGIILYEKSKEIGMKLSDSFDDVYKEYKSSIQES